MGKAHYKGKDLTGVRSLQRKLTPDNVGSEKREPTSLRGIANKAKAAEGCTLRVKSCIADASTTEEPDEGKLHVWDCAGGAG